MKILPALALLAVLPSLPAQERDGRIFVEKPGIVLVKPQAWSPASAAQVVRFTGYADRRARGHANQGYFELRTASGGATRQYEASRVVEFLPQPDIPETIERDQRDQLAAQAARISAVSKTVPGAAVDLEKFARPLREAVAEFDSGKVRIQGVWISKTERQKRDSEKFENSLRRELLQAKSKADFNLESHPLFLALGQNAKDDPETQARVEALRMEYRKMAAEEQQGRIIERLRDSKIDAQQAAQLLGRLKTLDPPGEQAKRVLEQASVAAALDAKAVPIRDALNTALGGNPPVIPDSLALQVREFAGNVAAYLAGKPPAGIPAPLEYSAAFTGFVENWPRVSGLFEERQFVSATGELAKLESRAGVIGPNAGALISDWKKQANLEVDKFKKLSGEGDAALSAGNKAEAVGKFEEALAVMPDESLQKKLAALKAD